MKKLSKKNMAMIGGVILLIVLVLGWKKGWFNTKNKTFGGSSESPCYWCEKSLAFQSGVSDCSQECA